MRKAVDAIWGRSRGSYNDPAALRRVGWRLASLTASLLGVLLLALGGIFYASTRQVLFSSLEEMVKKPAIAAAYPARNILAHQGFFLRLRKQFAPDVPRCFRHREVAPGSVIPVVANQQSTALCGASGLLDAAAARWVLQGGVLTPVCGTAGGDSGPSFVCTVPVIAGNDRVIGVVQTSAPEEAYLQNLHMLLLTLMGITVFGLLASAAISVALARRALQPIAAAWQRQREFVADAAHELRTPLAILHATAELAIGKTDDEVQQEAWEQALVQGVHLTRFVEDLSLLARADSGALLMNHTPIALAQVVTRAVEDIEILAEEQEITLRTKIEQPALVSGDPARLRQLLLLLLDNALRYTPAGTIVTVQVGRHGSHARLMVRDTGPGIAPVDLPHVFERLYRADSARGSDGTGLGLAIARSIVEAHQGTIMVANAPEGGAVFTVTLPLLRA